MRRRNVRRCRVCSRSGKPIVWLGADRIPADYPTAQLVTPKKVVFKAPDGLEIHGQLFDNTANTTLARGAKKPAIIFVHGGPPRQMLLGWNYSDYYSNAYASNQYLASRGFIVLSVNYRLGIGYGRDFQHPAKGGAQGASEYLDVQGARAVSALAAERRCVARRDLRRVVRRISHRAGAITQL